MESLLSKINDKFTQLRCIRFDFTNLEQNCPYLKCINRHIPSLKELGVIGSTYPHDDFAGIVKSNGQLESLAITLQSSDFVEDIVQFLDESLPQLKHLKICGVFIDIMGPMTEYPNRFANLKSIEYDSSPIVECGCSHICYEPIQIREIKATRLRTGIFNGKP